MYKHGLTFPLIALLLLSAGPTSAQDSACQKQKQQLERAMREMGMLSEEEMQSRLDEVQRICDEHGDNLPDTDSPDSDATSPDQSQSAQKQKSPMSALTADYLAGEWCGVTGQQERGPWVFSPNGSYKIGILAGSSYTMRTGGDSVEHFRNRFDRLESKTTDHFVVYRFDRETVFRRGRCQ